MQSIEYTINGNKYTYEVWQNNETPYILDKIVTQDKALNINPYEYTNFDSLFKAIKDNVTSRNGICN